MARKSNDTFPLVASVVGGVAVLAALIAVQVSQSGTNGLGAVRKPRGTIISKDRARWIAGDWYDGQWSALYSFMSSGVYDGSRHDDYINEVNLCLSSSDVPEKYRRELNQLKKWFEYKRWEKSTI